MGIVGIGVDVLAAARIEAIVGRGQPHAARFARRILSGSELGHFGAAVAHQGAAAQARYLAARWCLKEALYKAAFPRQALRWRDISIAKDGPRPVAEVAWAPALAGARAHVSLSHDQGLFVAYAVVEAATQEKKEG